MPTPGYSIIDGGYSGGKMCRAQGEVWFRWEEKYALDPLRIYGIQVRVKQNALGGSGTCTLMAGFVGYGIDGTTLVDQQGVNTERFWQFFGAPTSVSVDGAWHLYDFFWRGRSAVGTPGGIYTAPGSFQTNVRFIKPIFGLNVGGDSNAQVDVDIIVIKDTADESGLVDITLEFPVVRATANAAAGAAAAAQADATVAKTAIEAISNDNLLTPAEKGSVIRIYAVLLAAKPDTDAKADLFAVSRTAYDSALTALQAYMVGLGLTIGVNEATWGASETIIDGPTFRAKFQTAALELQYLLNSISNKARQIANAAQDTADAAQETATTAATTAATAQGRLDDISSDSKLTSSEKRTVILTAHDLWDAKGGLDAQADLFSVSKTAYDGALNDLVLTYLRDTLGLTLNSNEAVWQATTTDIVGATFRAKYNTAYAERQALQNAIAAKAKSLADTANGSLTDIANDNVLTQGDKPAVVLQYSTVIGEQSGIDAEATRYSITTEKTSYDSAVSALTTYLGTLTSPVVWNDLSNKTTMTGATLRSKFGDVYAARQALLNKIAASAYSSASSALSQLTDITSDDVLTAGEKTGPIQWYAVIAAEQAGIDAQATSYSVTTEKTTYDNYVAILTSYLNGLTSPVAWNNTSDKTNLGSGGGATFRTRFQDVYVSRQALLNAILAKSKVNAQNAQDDATRALTSISGAKIFYNNWNSPPSNVGRIDGDEWFQRQPDGSFKILRWTGGDYPAGGWNLDLGAVPKITAGEIDAGQVNADHLNVNDINARGTIVVGQSQVTGLTGALGGKVPAGGAADDVNAGTTTINGGKIETGTLTASHLVDTFFSTINFATVTNWVKAGGVEVTGTGDVGHALLLMDNSTAPPAFGSGRATLWFDGANLKIHIPGVGTRTIQVA